MLTISKGHAVQTIRTLHTSILKLAGKQQEGDIRRKVSYKFGNIVLLIKMFTQTVAYIMKEN
jgi:ABC-type phosphate transport system permease subunit